MENSIRTIYAASLQSCMFRKQPYEVLEYTTLNEKLGVQPKIYPDENTYPSLGYWAIGKGGHTSFAGSDGTPLPKLVSHQATDAALFDQLPFVLRQIDNDIDAAQRARYALRKTIVFAGTTYVAYYLKRIPMSQNPSIAELVTVENGISTATPFVPTTANLNPVKTTASNTGANVISKDYITNTSKLPLIMTGDDMQELITACTILYGSKDYAIITEIALCSGVDKVITVNPDTGISFNFLEAIAVQVASFLTTFKTGQSANAGFELVVDFGSNDPLFRIA